MCHTNNTHVLELHSARRQSLEFDAPLYITAPSPTTASCPAPQEKYFQGVTLDCMMCMGTPAMTFAVSIGVVCMLLALVWVLRSCCWRRMNQRCRRHMRAVLKIVFVFLQVRSC